VIDAFIVEALALAGCAGLAVSLRTRAAAAPRSEAPSVSRSMRRLRRRHRRKVREIVALAHECLARHPRNSDEAFTARETLGRYLPDTLTAYLVVPTALRRTRRAGRPSPDHELEYQLRTLCAGLERLREAQAEIGAAHMAANGAFLDERFGPATRTGLRSDLSSAFDEVADVLGAAFRRV
jgi:hypothetical protein